MKPFSSILNAWLACSGKSQVDIAREIGMTRQHVNQHLSGAYKYPSYKTMSRYADLFGVSVPEFLAGPTPEVPA